MNRLINLFILPMVILFAMTATSCSDNEQTEQSNDLKEIVLTRSQQDIVDSQAKFAFDYYKNTAGEMNPANNFSLSPLSLSINLALLANGAGGDTYEALAKASHLPDIEVGELNELYRQLLHELLKMDNKVDLSLASALWHTHEINIKPGFAAEIQKYYGGTQITALDFSNEELVRNTVNQWATEKTNGMITEFIKSGDNIQSKKFILSDALYFKGEWKNGFDKAKTEKRYFTNQDHTQSYVETMATNGDFSVSKSRDFANVIALPYGNGAYSMYIITPAIDRQDTQVITFDRMESQIDYDWWVNTKSAMTTREVNLKLPKFSAKNDLESVQTYFPDLAQIFVAPDLTKMTDAEIGFLRIDQSVSIETSESGTTASSVTTASGMDLASPAYDFNVNRPFIYLIEEQSTGAILFMGRVVKL